MTHHDNHSQLKHFIQEGLGCGCPEEVFDSIEISAEACGELPECAIVRVLVGRRLLIHFLFIDSTGNLSKEVIMQLGHAGRIHRDENGYNRFRLVLAVEDPKTLPASITVDGFDRLKADDRTYLHICKKNEIPAILVDYQKSTDTDK